MIDFHVILRDGKEPSPFQEKALLSLMGRNVYFIFNNEGYISSRVKGYSLGTSEYVSYVDDDDVAVDVDLVYDVLKSKPTALYTNSLIIDQDDKHLNTLFNESHVHDPKLFSEWRIMIHQLAIVRRDIAIESAEHTAKFVTKYNLPLMFDQVYFHVVSNLTDWTYLPKICYHWRHWNFDKQHFSRGGEQYHRLQSILKENPEALIPCR